MQSLRHHSIHPWRGHRQFLVYHWHNLKGVFILENTLTFNGMKNHGHFHRFSQRWTIWNFYGHCIFNLTWWMTCFRLYGLPITWGVNDHDTDGNVDISQIITHKLTFKRQFFSSRIFQTLADKQKILFYFLASVYLYLRRQTKNKPS